MEARIRYVQPHRSHFLRGGEPVTKPAGQSFTSTVRLRPSARQGPDVPEGLSHPGSVEAASRLGEPGPSSIGTSYVHQTIDTASPLSRSDSRAHSQLPTLAAAAGASQDDRLRDDRPAGNIG